jgi:hypothetical protein
MEAKQLDLNTYPKLSELVEYWSLCVILPLNAQDTPSLKKDNAKGECRLPVFLRQDRSLFERVLFLICGDFAGINPKFWGDLLQLSTDHGCLPFNVRIITEVNLLPLGSIVSAMLARERTKVLFVDSGTQQRYRSIAYLDIFDEIRRQERLTCSPHELNQLSELRFRDFFVSQIEVEQDTKP